MLNTHVQRKRNGIFANKDLLRSPKMMLIAVLLGVSAQQCAAASENEARARLKQKQEEDRIRIQKMLGINFDDEEPISEAKIQEPESSDKVECGICCKMMDKAERYMTPHNKKKSDGGMGCDGIICEDCVISLTTNKCPFCRNGEGEFQTEKFLEELPNYKKILSPTFTFDLKCPSCKARSKMDRNRFSDPDDLDRTQTCKQCTYCDKVRKFLPPWFEEAYNHPMNWLPRELPVMEKESPSKWKKGLSFLTLGKHWFQERYFSFKADRIVYFDDPAKVNEKGHILRSDIKKVIGAKEEDQLIVEATDPDTKEPRKYRFRVPVGKRNLAIEKLSAYKSME